MIKINGSINHNAVDLTRKIEVNWSMFERQQDAYQLYIVDESNTVLFQEERESKAPFTTIQLNGDTIFEKRRKLKVKVVIYAAGIQSQNFDTIFYTANKCLSKAKWITRKDNPIEKEVEFYKDKPNIILKKSFSYYGEQEKDIFLDICGLGYYKVTINGKPVDHSYLNNDVTNYSKRVYYDTYNIGEFINRGMNEISVELANGWYNPAPIKLMKKYNIRNQVTLGKPCLIAQLTELSEYSQEILLETDQSWHSEMGNYLFDNIYIGERISFSDKQPEEFERKVDLTTVSIAGPSGELVPSEIPKVIRSKKYKPISFKKVNEGYIVEFDRIITGHFSCEISSKKRTTINIKYSEEIDDQNLDFSSTSFGTYDYPSIDNSDEIPAVIQEDTLKLEKGSNIFGNQFTYHSFKYAFIIGEDLNSIEIKDIHAYSVHTDMEQSSSFKSSNRWLEELYQAGLDTKLNNIHSYYEDCSRERLGYGGDIVALIESQIYSFDSWQLLEKVLIDFELGQNQDGSIPQTTPYVGIQTHGSSNRAGSLGWQYVIPTILKKLIKYYGKQEKYTDKLPLVEKHIHYLLSFDYDYIKYCCLGDWGSIDTILVNNKETPPDKAFCSAVFYLLLLKDYKEILINIEQEDNKKIIGSISLKIDDVENKIIEEFYDKAGYFETGSQSSFVFALKAKLGPDQNLIYNNFIEKIKKDDNVIRTGIFGMAWVYEVLDREDHYLIYNWLCRKNSPSYYTMLANGNKVLSEYFVDDNDKYLNMSKNHAMFSSFGAWFFQALLGLDISPQAKSSGKLIVEPYFPEDMEFASGHIQTTRGKVSSSWSRKKDNIELVLYVPQSINLQIKGRKKVVYQDKGSFYDRYLIVYKG